MWSLLYMVMGYNTSGGGGMIYMGLSYIMVIQSGGFTCMWSLLYIYGNTVWGFHLYVVSPIYGNTVWGFHLYVVSPIYGNTVWGFHLYVVSPIYGHTVWGFHLYVVSPIYIW